METREVGEAAGSGGRRGGAGGVAPGGAGGQLLDDPSRLASLALSGLMDVRGDDVLDRLVAVAARAVQVPVVLVSLVDTARQRFPSQVGLTEPWASRAETPLSHSFCQHVVRSGAPLVVYDAGATALVSGNQAIPDLGVRAYAGYPLRDESGNVLGSFCVIDTRPRDWTDGELETVAGLGELAQSEIRARIALARARTRLTLLGEVTAGLQGRFEAEPAARGVCQQLVPALADACVVDLAEIDGGFRPVAVAAVDAATVAALETEERERPRQQNPGSTVRAVLDTGRSALGAETFGSGAPGGAAEPADLAEKRRLSMASAGGPPVLVDSAGEQRVAVRSSIVVPVRAGSRVAGAITLLRLGRSPAFEAADLHLAEEIGVRLGAAFDNAAAFQREHEVAVAFQSQLLSAPPEIADLDVAVRYRPSNRAAAVGGDWYDVTKMGDAVGLVVGDVAGHDLQAAASMGQVRAALRAYALEALSPSEVLDRVCRLVRIYSDDETVTAFYGILGPRRADGSRTLHHSRAGHPPAVLLVAGEPPRLLEDGLGPMIGVETDLRRSAQVDLPLGSTLVLYTDGLVEYRQRPVSTGLVEMVALLADVPDRSAGAVAEYLLMVMRPAGGWDDDVALLVVTLR